MRTGDHTMPKKAVTVLAPLLALLTAFLLAMTTLTATPTEAQAASSSETQTMYRLYNPNSGEHFYTASAGERDSVQASGWNYEGIAWTAPVSSSTPVYRLYSGTDHHYTTSVAEKNMLVKAGWTYENIGWYSDDAQGVPLYRQFNPNVDPSASYNNSGSHNYTTSKGENDHLVSIGWIAEDIGWYGVDTSKSNADSNEDPSADNVCEVSYADDVEVVEEGAAWVSNDGLSATVDAAGIDGGIGVGDIVVIYPTKENPLGQTIQVEHVYPIDGDASGMVEVSGSKPDAKEVISGIDISGTFKGDASDFRLADGTTLQTQSGDMYKLALSGTYEGDEIVINLVKTDIGDYGSVVGTLSIDPRVLLDISLNPFNRWMRVELAGDADLDFEVKVSLPDDAGRLKIGSLPILGTDGLGIAVDLYLVADAEGRIEVEAEADFSAWIDTSSFIPDVGASVTPQEPTLTAEITGKGGIEPKATVAIVGYDLADVAVQCGGQFDAKLEARPSLTCMDLEAWFYAQYSYHVLSNLFDKLSNDGVTIFDVNNSPFVFDKHFEDGTEVPECTYGKDGGEATYIVSSTFVDVKFPGIYGYFEESIGKYQTASCQYPQITCSVESEAVNKINETIRTQFGDKARQCETYWDGYSEDNLDWNLTACFWIDMHVTYLSDSIVSVIMLSDETNWGPHGWEEISCHTYSLETGDEIFPTDYFGITIANLADLTCDAVDVLAGNEPDLTISKSSSSRDYTKSYIQERINKEGGLDDFYFTDEGLVYRTAAYDLGSYADGYASIVVIPFDDESLFGKRTTDTTIDDAYMRFYQ